jgi:ribosome-associated protein
MTSWEKAVLLSAFALEKKAYDLIVVEVREVTSIADYFLICSGRSDRQVQSIAQGIRDQSGERDFFPAAIEGLTHGQWVLMDYSDVIVHIFYQPVRTFYDLERLWSHAPRAVLPEPYAALVRQFRIQEDGAL